MSFVDYTCETGWKQAYNRLSFQFGNTAIENEHRLNSEVEKFANAIEQSEKMSIWKVATLVVLIALHDLVKPNGNI